MQMFPALALLHLASLGAAPVPASPVAAPLCPSAAIIGDIRPEPGKRAGGVLIAGVRISAVLPVGAGAPAGLSPTCVTQLPAGAVAFAGLQDGHAHLLGIGLRELELNLEGTSSIIDLQRRTAAAAERLVPGETLYGRGWIETGWPEGRMPTAADLDAVVTDRPVILARADGHAAVVNSAALKAAGITAQTPDPAGGRIVRDAGGAATGLLIDNAEALVAPLLPKLTPARRKEALQLGAKTYAAMGWTAVHNMSVDWDDVLILEKLAAQGQLPLRVMNYVTPAAQGSAIARGQGCVAGRRVCLMGVKYYVDGALGSRGALLFAPYADEPATLGLQLISAADAIAGYRAAAAAGLQVTTHAIGDKGNHTVLEWYKAVPGRKADHRWRIEHAQVVRPNDVMRFAFGGVIASMQPSHAISDLYFAPARLGNLRLKGAYAWQSFLAAGVTVVGGSDAPVERGDPRVELYAATKRTSLDGFRGDNWHAEEAVGADDALAMFTTHAARAVFAEAELGRLAPGYRADLSVFSADPFTHGWDETTAIATYVDGVPVSGAIDAGAP